MGFDMEPRALAGLNVLDLSWVIVGPLTGKYLADHGATVVRVESQLRPDISRTNNPFRDNEPGLNRSVFHAAFNSSKRSIGLNLSHPIGQAVAKRLVAWADILIESFTVGTLDKIGLGYEQARLIRPDIIMLSSTGYGQTGPLARCPSYGVMLTGRAGFHSLTGWPDRDPVETYGAYTDFVVPPFQVALLMAALEHRERTGQGQHIDVSQYEAALTFVSPLLLDYAVNGHVASKGGNSCTCAAPHGVYRTLGEERWCAITVFSDRDWLSLCGAMDKVAFAADPRFDTVLQRKHNEGELDRLIEDWTSVRTAEDVMRRLQDVGVAAAVVHDPESLFTDEQLAYYEYFRPMEHPEIGLYQAQNLGVHLEKTPGYVANPAPCLGQDTEYVCKELLDIPEDEFVELLAEGVLE